MKKVEYSQRSILVAADVIACDYISKIRKATDRCFKETINLTVPFSSAILEICYD